MFKQPNTLYRCVAESTNGFIVGFVFAFFAYKKSALCTAVNLTFFIKENIDAKTVKSLYLHIKKMILIVQATAFYFFSQY